MKYFAAEVGPAMGAIGRLLLLLLRVFGQNGLIAAGFVFVVVAVVAGAVWYVRRTSKGEDAAPPETIQVPPQEERPVSRVTADDGYFKKCAACGKFTRDAKVCRNCGRDFTDKVRRG